MEPTKKTKHTVTIFAQSRGHGFAVRIEADPGVVPAWETELHYVSTMQAKIDVLEAFAKHDGHEIEIVVKHDKSAVLPPAPLLATDVMQTAGELDENGLRISWGGACPVQGDGTVDGHPCYYRARGMGWAFTVWPRGAELGEHGLPKGDPIFTTGDAGAYLNPEAGWLHASETIANLRRANEICRVQLPARRKADLLGRLRSLAWHRDAEVAHEEADQLLVDYINDPEIATAYDLVTKWYS